MSGVDDKYEGPDTELDWEEVRCDSCGQSAARREGVFAEITLDPHPYYDPSTSFSYIDRLFLCPSCAQPLEELVVRSHQREASNHSSSLPR
jgi:rubredoxin